MKKEMLINVAQAEECRIAIVAEKIAYFKVGQDQRRFAAQAHQQSSTFPNGGPALEANWSHPTPVMCSLRSIVDTVCDDSNRGLAPSG